MNKRQVKKKENNMILLQGMSYKEHSKSGRAYQEYLIYFEHIHKHFKGFDEEEKMLIEMGIWTPEEVISKYGRCRTNTRWRQIRKVNERKRKENEHDGE